MALSGSPFDTPSRKDAGLESLGGGLRGRGGGESDGEQTLRLSVDGGELFEPSDWGVAEAMARLEEPLHAERRRRAWERA